MPFRCSLSRLVGRLLFPDVATVSRLIDGPIGTHLIPALSSKAITQNYTSVICCVTGYMKGDGRILTYLKEIYYPKYTMGSTLPVRLSAPCTMNTYIVNGALSLTPQPWCLRRLDTRPFRFFSPGLFAPPTRGFTE